MNKPLSNKRAQEIMDAVAKCGSLSEASRFLNLPRNTAQSRHKEAIRRGLHPSAGVDDKNNIDHVKARLKRAEAKLKIAESKALDHDMVKRVMFNLVDSAKETPIPTWILETKKAPDAPGIPTVFVSDLHWAEVVDPKQINGVNKYNLVIAKGRIKRLAEGTIRLLSILSPNMDYPGIVIPLGGDLVSGNIHDELTATNELNSMPTVLDMVETLGAFINTMANKFGRVFLPCVSGNHGRATMKIWNKDRHATSFDWLICKILETHFVNDKRVTFFIPDGPDAYYKVYNHKYLLTHGDQFRGGDGLIGPIGAVIRGDHKKRSRNSQIDLNYDTMIMGHFHGYTHLTRLIINGSLKGMDEYAYNGNFSFEPPQQALWVTHPAHGITFRMPVFVDEKRKFIKTSWVSVPK